MIVILLISRGDVYYLVKHQKKNHTADENRHRFTGGKSALKCVIACSTAITESKIWRGDEALGSALLAQNSEPCVY